MNKDITVEEITVQVADEKYLGYVDTILTTIADAAKVRGTGIARRSPEYIEQKIKEGKGMHLAPEEWMGFYSYQSVFDTLNPDGDYNIFPYYESLNNLRISTKELFREFKSINKPTQVLYGESDEYCYGRVREIVEKLKTITPHPDKLTFDILPECDHGFYGKEEVLVKTIAEWLAE